MRPAEISGAGLGLRWIVGSGILAEVYYARPLRHVKVGTALEDRRGRRSYVTSAGSGPSAGKHILLSYIPPEQAEAGRKLSAEYFGERYPVTVAVVGSTPLFDPENARVKA